MIRIPFFFGLLLALALPLAAQTDTISYHNGRSAGFYTGLTAGDIEAVCFNSPHPCTLLAVGLYVANPNSRAATLQLHIWKDFGYQPGVDQEPWTDSLEVPVEATVSQWITVDLRDRHIVIPPLTNFHVGHIKLTDDTLGMYVDSDTLGDSHSMLRIGVDWYSSTNYYMAWAYVSYHDIVTEKLFEDMAPTSGIAGGSRWAWGDYDNDRWDDLLVNGSVLYHNNHGANFTDVSSSAGVTGGGGGGIWADWDNDERLDFFMAAGQGGVDKLFHNNGDGTFADMSGQPNFDVLDPWSSEGIGWGDGDNDGFVDMYVANYERAEPESMSRGTPDFYWQNYGGTLFVNEATERGIARAETPTRKCGRGVNWADFDHDGDMDIYVSNYRLNPNFLFNNNYPDTYFDEAAGEFGVIGTRSGTSYGHTIGSEWGDYDNDGDLDLIACNLAHPRYITFSDKTALYRNAGPPNYYFDNVREEAGILYDETHSDPSWGDYDNDGWLDLFITSVYVGRKSWLYHNNQDGTFSVSSYEAGIWVDNGWGAAWCDYDRDGFLDLVAGSEFHLYHNRGNANHWVEVRLAGTLTNRAAIGTQVRCYAGSLTMLREVEGGKGTSNQHSLVQHFGLAGNTTVDSLVIEWLGTGTAERNCEVYRNLPADDIYRAVENEGITSIDRDVPIAVSSQALRVSPNPTGGRVTIDIPLIPGRTEMVVVYRLDGTNGTNLGPIGPGPGQASVTWDAGNAGRGMYIVRVGTRTVRVVVR